jgi:hypothetical protein
MNVDDRLTRLEARIHPKPSLPPHWESWFDAGDRATLGELAGVMAPYRTVGKPWPFGVLTDGQIRRLADIAERVKHD